MNVYVTSTSEIQIIPLDPQKRTKKQLISEIFHLKQTNKMHLRNSFKTKPQRDL